MSTFLLFVLIFGLFAWGMWRLLKFTRDTVGENSPLKVSRVYQISKFRYFTGFDGIMAYLFILLGLILFFRFSNLSFPSDTSSPTLLYLAVFLVPLLLLGFSVLTFAWLLNHWLYVRDVIIRTNPADHSLDITLSDRTFTIRQGTSIGSKRSIANSNTATHRTLLIIWLMEKSSSYRRGCLGRRCSGNTFPKLHSQ